MRELTFFVIGAMLALIVSNIILMKRKQKTDSKSFETLKALTKTPETKKLIQTQEFFDVIQTPEFRNMVKEFGKDYINSLILE